LKDVRIPQGHDRALQDGDTFDGKRRTVFVQLDADFAASAQWLLLHVVARVLFCLAL
jgi:hypothetical protein